MSAAKPPLPNPAAHVTTTAGHYYHKQIHALPQATTDHAYHNIGNLFANACSRTATASTNAAAHNLTFSSARSANIHLLRLQHHSLRPHATQTTPHLV